jgi:hypothetical protein
MTSVFIDFVVTDQAQQKINKKIRELWTGVQGLTSRPHLNRD